MRVFYRISAIQQRTPARGQRYVAHCLIAAAGLRQSPDANTITLSSCRWTYGGGATKSFKNYQKMFLNSRMTMTKIGGIAPWLGRWSLASGISLTCARSIVDTWPSVGKLSAMGLVTSAFHLSEVGKWVVIHVFTWITEEGDHQNCRLVWLQFKIRVCRLGLRPRLTTQQINLKQHAWHYHRGRKIVK